MNPPAAPEFRRDPVTGRWVVVAPGRSLRPMTLREAAARDDPGTGPCPFCPGNEHDTPHEVLAYRAPGSPADGPGWRLRVVPNRYPAVGPPGAADPRPAGPPLFARAPAAGRHEVLVECPEHLVDPLGMTAGQLGDVFRAYRDRLAAFAADDALRYAAVFKNVGAEAGASIAHTHSQVVALPWVPPAAAEELGGAAEYHAGTGRCVFCDLIREELAAGVRVVAASPGFVAVAAFAPRFAYEVWVLPRAHEARYERLADAAAADLAGLVRRVLGALDAVLPAAAYNWYLHTAPLRSADLPYYHWHLELTPRTGRPAGLEWGSGCFVTAVAPERAAALLSAAAGAAG